MWRQWRIDVEWMDGKAESYVCGGALNAEQAMRERSGLLLLWHKNGELAPTKHVVTIPMENVRHYVAVDL